MQVNKNLLTFFYRCPECGGEFLNTEDLNLTQPWTLNGYPPKTPEPPVCNCGAPMQSAPIPRLVIPEPGGDGQIYEVEELKR